METGKGLQPVDCRGTLREIGRQYGEACAERIRGALEEFYGVFSVAPTRPDRAAVRGVGFNLLESARAFDGEAIGFIEGQAEGAGLEFADMFALHCMIELLFNYQSMAAMCTSFAVTGEATVGGKTIAGQNIDWFVSSPVDLLKVRYQDGLTAFAICLSGVPYYHLTSAGIANCANLTLGRLPQGVHVPLGVYLPKAMRQRSIDGALTVVRTAARGYGYYHFADARGTMVGIESIDTGYTLMRPERGVMVHANHYEMEAYRDVDWEQIIPCTRFRSARLRELIGERHGEITPQVMMELLCDHRNHPNAICKHPDPAVPPQFAGERFFRYGSRGAGDVPFVRATLRERVCGVQSVMFVPGLNKVKCGASV